jgi:hypothetical protein
MRGLALVVLVGCYSPTPRPGSPCTDDTNCPTPLVCSPLTMTCEHDRYSSTVDGSTSVDGDIDGALIDGCTPTAEICGDSIDQDCEGTDPACAANDVASGAINVTAGGTFPGNALLARDDVAPNGCGNTGGRDLFYRVNISSPEVYYFDTFGSTFDTVVRVYRKPCAQVGTGASPDACDDDSCNGDKSRALVPLPSGESCIVVDQDDASEGGMLSLRVIRGGRNGLTLATGMQTVTGNTTTATDVTDPIDQCDEPGADGRDIAYFFMVCPNTSMLLDADICPEPAWDPVLYVSRVDNATQLECSDDDCGWGPRMLNVPINNGRLFVLYVDGYDPSYFGPFSLDTNIR